MVSESVLNLFMRNSLHAGLFFMILLLTFFQNELFKKNSFRNVIRVSNHLNPDLDLKGKWV